MHTYITVNMPIYKTKSILRHQVNQSAELLKNFVCATLQ